MKLSKVILFLAVSLAMGINVIVNQAGVYAQVCSKAPANCPRFKEGDVTCDGVIDQKDIDEVVKVMRGGISSRVTDVNCDGIVDISDFGVVITAKNPTVGPVNNIQNKAVNSFIGAGNSQSKSKASTALVAPAAAAVSPDPPKLCAIEQVMARVLEVALGLAGLAVFLMFIYGGFKWLTAGTDEKAVQQARGTFTMAITGLALAMVAWFILLFVQQFTGIQVTTFDIPWIGNAGPDPCP